MHRQQWQRHLLPQAASVVMVPCSGKESIGQSPWQAHLLCSQTRAWKRAQQQCLQAALAAHVVGGLQPFFAATFF